MATVIPGWDDSTATPPDGPLWPGAVAVVLGVVLWVVILTYAHSKGLL